MPRERRMAKTGSGGAGNDRLSRYKQTWKRSTKFLVGRVFDDDWKRTAGGTREKNKVQKEAEATEKRLRLQWYAATQRGYGPA